MVKQRERGERKEADDGLTCQAHIRQTESLNDISQSKPVPFFFFFLFGFIIGSIGVRAVYQAQCNATLHNTHKHRNWIRKGEGGEKFGTKNKCRHTRPRSHDL